MGRGEGVGGLCGWVGVGPYVDSVPKQIPRLALRLTSDASLVEFYNAHSMIYNRGDAVFTKKEHYA